MIQVGEVLDKYELLERVGQGGMAIVYRGLDRSLKRVVAVKILHRHLADYQEARDRFQREAQAVAKLRHDNILEIFDYSAKEGSESYIVTEFIDGHTLKQVITDRPIVYPEIGAMVVLQVCRALAHAHAGSILHRDVKPENIMIRSDGVVKLMDFGISHMVDLERLTVTGQLLGSPAYMAPEHVEGRPLDFRTDVFAAGIVLYQLGVGKLPFEGKNPHEVLKRIAECKFVDPRQANPRIGNRLGRIILRAMAASPDDRYPSIAEMVVALEGYLDESGLPSDKIPAELARYFSAPASYEEALKTRLVDTLTRAGQAKLDDDNRAGALDAFDRVMTIDAQNARVLAILDRLNRRARLKTGALAVLGIGVVALGAYFVNERQKPGPSGAPNVDVASALTLPATTTIAHDDPPPPPRHDEPIGSAAAVAAIARDAADVTPSPDASVAVEPTIVNVRVLPGSSYFDGAHWIAIKDAVLPVAVTDRAVDVQIKSPETAIVTVHVEPGAKVVNAEQQFVPGTITPHCTVAGASVEIAGQTRKLDNPATILFEHNAMSSTQIVKVVFYDASGRADTQEIDVTAGKTQEVTCGLH
ncbi:MAG TPA: serine/threonine-protein kinase [Kofleriaceae bacterium]|nr:serine/threonine-protein kinase [Kofleriaceae bacterium]